MIEASNVTFAVFSLNSRACIQLVDLIVNNVRIAGKNTFGIVVSFNIEV